GVNFQAYTPAGGIAFTPVTGTSFGTASDPGVNNVAAGGYVQTGVVTVTSLPACNAGRKGARHFVSDSNAPSFTAGIGAVVAGGGTTNVPVTCDGTNWRIG